MARETQVSVVWFRHDLRLADNPALEDAVRRGAVTPVYVWSPEEEGPWQPGGAARVWLNDSLGALDAELRRLGSRLTLRRGKADREILAAARYVGADRVVWNRRYEPAPAAQEKRVAGTLESEGFATESFKGGLLFEPWEIATKDGNPYQVFTPFWRACLRTGEPPQALPRPGAFDAPSRWPASEDLASLGLDPGQDWADDVRRGWAPGEQGAHDRLETFLDEVLADYKDERERLAAEGTSRLSPHLHFGEVSPRAVWHAVCRASSSGDVPEPARETFLSELGWREFAHHVLYHFPDTPASPLRAKFERFPWRDDEDAARAWRRGRTGYPLVDAGMRQLWATGWMHNRVRMAVASFLTKDLLLPWQAGTRWFWDTLFDADLANNTLNWQWAGGCGADAAPYFRIFNPVTQSRKFDPGGAYLRRWVPELAELPDRWVHEPWNAPADTLRDANVRLGETYPRPVVDHREARTRALEAFETTKGA